jgi:hypothetical protein
MHAGQRIRLAGMAPMWQRHGTVKWITFITVEDEYDPADLVVNTDVDARTGPKVD